MIQVITDSGYNYGKWMSLWDIFTPAVSEYEAKMTKMPESDFKIRMLDNVRPFFLTDFTGKRAIMGQPTRLIKIKDEYVLEACDEADDEKILLLSITVPGKNDGNYPISARGSSDIDIIYFGEVREGYMPRVLTAAIRYERNDLNRQAEPFLRLKVTGNFPFSTDECDNGVYKFVSWNTLSDWQQLKKADVKILEALENSDSYVKRFFGENCAEEIERLAKESRRIGMNQRRYIYLPAARR